MYTISITHPLQIVLLSPLSFIKGISDGIMSALVSYIALAIIVFVFSIIKNVYCRQC